LNKESDIKEILVGCLKGKTKYQRALVDNYAGLLYVVCYRYLGNAPAAQDAMQESLSLIFLNLAKYKTEKGKFESWASTIAIRYCLGRLAKNRSRTKTLMEVTKDPKVSDLEKEMISSLNADHLMELVAELEEPQRSVFNMAAIDGYTHKEIAKELNLTEINCRTLLKRARRILRDKINSQIKRESWVNTI